MTDIDSTTGGGSAISWRTVEVFPNRGMADVAGSALRSAGMAVRVMADDVQSIGLPLGLRFNGAELQVPTGDVEEARALLEGELDLDPEAQGLDPEDAEEPWLTEEHRGAEEAAGTEGAAQSELDLGLGMAGKVIAGVLLVVLLAAALWGLV